MANYFNSASDYYLSQFHSKVYKITLNGGFTCPNRDGTLSSNGCIFCSEGGSGEFSPSEQLTIPEQIEASIALIQNKYKGNKFIAYFQSFSNTYGSLEKLKFVFTQALNDSRIVALNIGTRPDCFNEEILELLTQLNLIKPVYIELGLQTIHEHTASFINRGYPLSVFNKTVHLLAERNIPVIVHLIIGLPHETHDELMHTIQYMNQLPLHGVKLQLLHLLKNTPLEKYYLENPFPILSQNQYIEWLIDSIEILSPKLIIYRITGDGPKNILIEPKWSLNKLNVLNQINRRFKERNTYQGKYLLEEKNE